MHIGHDCVVFFACPAVLVFVRGIPLKQLQHHASMIYVYFLLSPEVLDDFTSRIIHLSHDKTAFSVCGCDTNNRTDKLREAVCATVIREDSEFMYTSQTQRGAYGIWILFTCSDESQHHLRCALQLTNRGWCSTAKWTQPSPRCCVCRTWCFLPTVLAEWS